LTQPPIDGSSSNRPKNPATWTPTGPNTYVKYQVEFSSPDSGLTSRRTFATEEQARALIEDIKTKGRYSSDRSYRFSKMEFEILEQDPPFPGFKEWESR